MADLLRIGELASQLGTTTKTLRFYERIGLIGAPTRNQAGYRLYAGDCIKNAQLVINLRRLGLSIEELQELMSEDEERSLRKRLSSILDQKLFNLDQELGVLQGKREDLAARLEALFTAPPNRPANCVCDALLTDCHCSPES